MNREIEFRAWDENSEKMITAEDNISGNYIWEFYSECEIRILEDGNG